MSAKAEHGKRLRGPLRVKHDHDYDSGGEIDPDEEGLEEFLIQNADGAEPAGVNVPVNECFD